MFKTIGGDDSTDGKIGLGKGTHVWVMPKGCEVKVVANQDSTETNIIKSADIEALLKPKKFNAYRPGTYVHTGYQSDIEFNDFGPWILIVITIICCCSYILV